MCMLHGCEERKPQCKRSKVKQIRLHNNCFIEAQRSDEMFIKKTDDESFKMCIALHVLDSVSA